MHCVTQLVDPAPTVSYTRFRACVQCGTEVPEYEARHTGNRCRVCNQRPTTIVDQSLPAREQYRQLWRVYRLEYRKHRRGLHWRNYASTLTEVPGMQRAALDMIDAWKVNAERATHDYRVQNTLANLRAIKSEMEAGTAIGGGAGGYRIEFVDNNIKVWRAA